VFLRAGGVTHLGELARFLRDGGWIDRTEFGRGATRFGLFTDNAWKHNNIRDSRLADDLTRLPSDGGQLFRSLPRA
jgi:hypothetical protein